MAGMLIINLFLVDLAASRYDQEASAEQAESMPAADILAVEQIDNIDTPGSAESKKEE